MQGHLIERLRFILKVVDLWSNLFLNKFIIDWNKISSEIKTLEWDTLNPDRLINLEINNN